LAGILLQPTLGARAVDQRVAAVVPEIKAIERSASHFGPNPSSPKAKEELIVVVTCQENTGTQGFTLKSKKTEAESARYRVGLLHAWSSVSRAFVRT